MLVARSYRGLGVVLGLAGACGGKSVVDPESSNGGSGGSSARGGSSGNSGAVSSGGSGGGGGVSAGGSAATFPGAGGGTIVTGGYTGVGGIAGSGGGATVISCNNSPGFGGPLLIDDVQDADNAIEKSLSGRTGWWYVSDDGTGFTHPPSDPSGVIALVPEADPENIQNILIHMSGSGHTSWGASLVVGLRAGTIDDCLFDASAFSGISFRIKGSGSIHVKLPIARTLSSANSPLGKCTGACDDHFGAGAVLSETWRTVTYLWSELTQEGWGVMTVFSPTELTEIQWHAGPSSAFDVYIDDVTFTP
jgi:hypothetical protein